MQQDFGVLSEIMRQDLKIHNNQLCDVYAID